MILLMGSAGAGKGTQAKLLAEKDGFSYISTGEMLRARATPEQQARMLRGELLKDQEILAMVDQALAELPDPDHCILDGIPRTIAQADWVLAQVKKGRFNTPVIINLVASEKEVLKRLLLRGRTDDTKEAIATRFEEHKRATLPMIKHFKQAGSQVFEVNAAQDPEAVHDDVIRVLNTLSKQ